MVLSHFRYHFRSFLLLVNTGQIIKLNTWSCFTAQRTVNHSKRNDTSKTFVFCDGNTLNKCQSQTAANFPKTIRDEGNKTKSCKCQSKSTSWCCLVLLRREEIHSLMSSSTSSTLPQAHRQFNRGPYSPLAEPTESDDREDMQSSLKQHKP